MHTVYIYYKKKKKKKKLLKSRTFHVLSFSGYYFQMYVFAVQIEELNVLLQCN